MSDAAGAPPGMIQIFINDQPLWVDQGFSALPPEAQRQKATEMWQKTYGERGTRLEADQPDEASPNYSDPMSVPTVIPPIPTRPPVNRVLSGFNRSVIQHGIGGLGDLAAGLWNQGVLPDVNAAARAFGYGKPSGLNDLVTREATGKEPAPFMAPIVDPIYGSKRIGQALEAARLVEPPPGPEDTTGKLLEAAGAGVGGAVTALVPGRALSALGQASRAVPNVTGQPQIVGRAAGLGEQIGNALSYGSYSGRGLTGQAALGAGTGVSSELGADAVSQFTDDPTARALGAVVGGLAGGTGLAVGGAMGSRFVNAAKEASRPFTQGGRQVLANRIMGEAAANGPPPADQPGTIISQGITGIPPSGPLAEAPLGSQPTAGQYFNNPGLIRLERTAEASLPPGEAGKFADQRTLVNQTVLGSMDRLTSSGTISDRGANMAPASEVIAQNLRSNRESARQVQSAAHENIDPNDEILALTTGLKQNLASAIRGLRIARQDLVPQGIIRIIRDFPDWVPLGELTALRARLNADIRTAYDAKKWSEHNVLQRIDEALFRPLTDTEGQIHYPLQNPEKAAIDSYQNAQRLSLQYHQTFNRGEMGKVFEQTRGVDTVPASNVAEHLLGTNTPGQAERAQQFITAARANPETAEQTLQAGRDWFADKMRLASRAAGEDTHGSFLTLGRRLRDFVDKNSGLIRSELFTADQRALIDEIVQAANMVERTQRGGTPNVSNTAHLLQSGNYLQDAVGTWMSRALNMGVRGVSALAGHHAGGPLGGLLGWAGSRGATAELYKAQTEKVMRLVMDGLQDPEVATRMVNAARGKEDPAQLLPRIAQIDASIGPTAATTAPLTDRPPPVDAATDMVNRLGPGERITVRMLGRATGINDDKRLEVIRQELISKGVIRQDNRGVYRRATPVSPNQGNRPAPDQRGEANPLEEGAYKAAQSATPTLRRSTFNEVADDITGRPSPLYGQLSPGGLFEQLANGHATHETMELAARTRAIAPDDWRILQSKANNWAKQLNVPDDLPVATRRHEAIATAYNMWSNGAMQMPPGLRRIFGNYRSFSEVA